MNLPGTHRANRPFFGCLILLLVALLSVAAFPPESTHDDLMEEDSVELSMDGSTMDNDTPDTNYVVLQVLPHDDRAFTQGLTYFNGNLWEGTGLYHESELRRVDPNTGTVLQTHKLESKYFGEGIAHFTDKDGNGRIIQITWKRQVGWIYNAETFEIVKEFTYSTKTTEGWGITYNENENEFIVSDGSSHLFFWDRDTLEQKRHVEVHIKFSVEDDSLKQPMNLLNELEWHKGAVLANVWYQDYLLRIDPATGSVSHIYDFSNLYQNRAQSADCFNGISVTDMEDELWVTGKHWPNMYRIKLLV